MTRRTAGALIGWGGFLSVASLMAIAFVVAGLNPVVAATIGVIFGTFAGCGSRHGVDREWPNGIVDPDRADAGPSENVGLDILRHQPEPRRTLRTPDPEQTVIVQRRDVFPTLNDTVVYDRNKLGLLDRQQPGSRRAGGPR